MRDCSANRGAARKPPTLPPNRAASADGESFSIETGGGGGVLPPADRDRDLVKGDLQDGLLTPRKAREVYGLTEEEVASALG